MYRWIGLFVLAACGGPMNMGGAGGGSSGGGTCCLNGSFYDCQTKASFDKCVGFDVGACHSACSGSDFMCHMTCDTQSANATRDPSSCVRGASRDSQCSTGGGGGGGGGLCVGSRGVACTYSTQCSSGNCHDGHCYPRSNGNPCDYSTQCDSANCTNNCCSGNSKGDACTYSTQCSGSNCTAGKCQ